MILNALATLLDVVPAASFSLLAILVIGIVVALVVVAAVILLVVILVRNNRQKRADAADRSQSAR